MAGPWEKYQQAPQGGPWAKYGSPVQEPDAAAPPQQSGMILPISRSAEGNLQFDSNAGILGMAKAAASGLKDAFMLPGDAMQGKIQIMGPDGRVTPEAIGRSLGFAAAFSPATPGLRAGERVIPGQAKALRETKVSPPSADDLYAEASRNFKQMRDSGVDYSAGSVKNAADAMKRALEQEGFDAEVASKTHRILDKLANPPEGSVANIKGLHSARKTFGKIAQNFNDPTDQAAASQAIRGLDEFIGGSGAESVVAGTASDAAQALKAANANFAAAKRSDMLTGIERAADLRAAAANSGANSGNAIRQRIASALLQPKKVSGFNPEEVAALEGIVKGSRAQNATRAIGNVLGGGGGLGQLLTGAAGAGAGGAAAGPSGAAIGAALPVIAGTGSRELSNIMTRRALEAADALVRSRSPLYERMAANPSLTPVSAEQRAALARALLLYGQARNQ